MLDIFKAITSTPLELPPEVPISSELAHLFGRLFEKDPTQRITIQVRRAAGRRPVEGCRERGDRVGEEGGAHASA
jgi:hypothetical protein